MLLEKTFSKMQNELMGELLMKLETLKSKQTSCLQFMALHYLLEEKLKQ